MPRDIRFVRTRTDKELSLTWLHKLDRHARELTWESIADFLFHINENTWELSETFGIHPGAVTSIRKVFCEERFVPRYEVWEYVTGKILDSNNQQGKGASWPVDGETGRSPR